MPDLNLLSKEIEIALDNAENMWKEVETEVLNEQFIKSIQAFALTEERKIPSLIPGFPFIEEGKPKVAMFIALVLDIRGSTNHLTQRISPDKAKASQLERVLYEMTAINTAGAVIIDDYGGGITEFLGDGFLALFKVSDESNPKEVYSAHNSAKYFINSALPKINEILDRRYSLPPIMVGIGLAFSKAIVTIVGSGKNIHPKAIGECVYRASKLSDGSNEILIDERLKHLWPTSKGGKLRFDLLRGRSNDFNSYLISKSN